MQPNAAKSDAAFRDSVYSFACDCLPRQLCAALINGWEVWSLDEHGNLGNLDDAGSDGWDDLTCATCSAPVTIK